MRLYLPLLFLFFASPFVYSLDTGDLRNGGMVSPADAKSWIEEEIIGNNLAEVDRVLSIYRANFSKVDFPKIYLDIGMGFYTNQNKMLALKSFLRGYEYFSSSPYRIDCGYQAARIFYQIGNRESSLFYINRLLDRTPENHPLRGELAKLKRRVRWEYLSRLEGLPDESVSDITFDGDDVWIALWTGGVTRYTRSSQTIKVFLSERDGLLSNHTRDLKIFKGRVWVATFDGLCSYSKRSGVWEREDGKIGGVTVKRLRTAGGRLYAATLGKGLFELNEETQTWKNVFTKATNITDIQETNGSLYISALEQGIFILRGPAVLHVLPGVSVKTLAFRNGLLWAGTHGQGLFSLDFNGNVLGHFQSQNGVPADYIETIEPVGKYLIIGTLENGALIFRPEENGWRRLTVLDGLPSNDVVRIAVEKNRIWFGTLSGGIGIMLTENLEDI